MDQDVVEAACAAEHIEHGAHRVGITLLDPGERSDELPHPVIGAHGVEQLDQAGEFVEEQRLSFGDRGSHGRESRTERCVPQNRGRRGE